MSGETFTLDRSGEVALLEAGERLPAGTRGVSVWPHLRSWCDLTPFQQGYVEALFESATVELWIGCGGTDPALHGYEPLAFRDLSPASLERIIGDCEEVVRQLPDQNSKGHGELFWQRRQRGAFGGWPALRVTLSDAGKVELEDAR